MATEAPERGKETWANRWARVRQAVRETPRGARFLLVSSYLAALPFGFLLVYFPLYLHHLGWSAATIGGLLLLVGVSGAALTVVIGPLADRLGRRLFLLVGTGLPVVGFVLLALTAAPGWIVAASFLSVVGYTGSISGALTNATFFPTLSDLVSAESRTTVVSWMEAGLSLCEGFGMLLAGAPTLLAHAHVLPMAAAGRTIFLACALLTLLAAALLWPVCRRPLPAATRRAHQRVPWRPHRRLILTLAVFYGLQGAGLGLTVQLLPLWFHLRFHSSTATLAPWFAATQFASVLSVAMVPTVSRRIGTARVIVGGGVLGVLALAGVALAPAFLLAGVGIIVRAAAVGAQWTAQQSFLQGCIAPGLRATATSVALGCWGLATALLPLPAGHLLDHHLLVWPLILGVVCYAGAALWFWLTLRGTTLPEEEVCEPGASDIGCRHAGVGRTLIAFQAWRQGWLHHGPVLLAGGGCTSASPYCDSI